MAVFKEPVLLLEGRDFISFSLSVGGGVSPLLEFPALGKANNFAGPRSCLSAAQSMSRGLVPTMPPGIPYQQ